jgi:hypothetical protein
LEHCIQNYFTNYQNFLINGFYLCFFKGPWKKLF